MSASFYFGRAPLLPCPSRVDEFLAVIALIALLLPSTALASELTGRIWDPASGAAPTGGELKLKCSSTDYDESIPLAGDGSYSLREVPSGASCQLTVTSDSGSAFRQINVGGSVVRFDAEARVVGDRFVLIPR